MTRPRYGAGTHQPTPPDCAACWSGSGATRPVWPRCCSTPARRCTSPAWRAATRKESRGRATRWGPAPPGRRWSASGEPALVLPDDADDDSLDDHVALVEAQGSHLGIRRLQPDPAAGLAVELLDGGARAVHEGDHRLSVVRLVALLDHDEIAVLDVLVDHRMAPDAEHVAAAAPRQQFVGDGDGVVPGHGFDRLAGGDEAEQRELGRPCLALGRHDLDRAALVVVAADVPFALEVGQVLVDRRERGEGELAGDFLETGSVPVAGDVAREGIEDFALATRERHWAPERKPNIIYPKTDRMQA